MLEDAARGNGDPLEVLAQWVTVPGDLLLEFGSVLLRLLCLAVASIAAICFCCVSWASLKPDRNPPRLRCKDSDLSRYLTGKVPGLTQPYLCPVWARSAHLHTVAAMLFPPVQHHGVIRYQRELLQLKDRGVVGLDWAVTDLQANGAATSGAPVILVVTGMTMDTMSTLRAAGNAMSRGFRPVVFRSRGTYGVPLFTPKLQSAGDGSDIRHVVRYLRAKYPKAPTVALSLGLGSGCLLSYLGEFGSSAHLSGAALVSPAWDTQDLVDRWPGPYSYLELVATKMMLAEHEEVLSKVVDVKEALECDSLRQVSQKVHCPGYGYSDMEEFWEKNNPLRDVDDISVPVVAIRSADDPICCPSSAPLDVFTVYPNFMLVTVEDGGHCGFLEGDGCDSWAVKLAVDCLRAILQFEARSAPRI